jgi:hypothetical protein
MSSDDEELSLADESQPNSPIAANDDGSQNGNDADMDDLFGDEGSDADKP